MSAPLTARQAPPAGRYALDPAGSSVTFETRHMSVSGVLTVKGRPAPLDLTVADVATEGGTLVFRASRTVDRYAHGASAMRGMAARHLTIQITADATRA